jgi:hypothetical protein
MLVVEGFQEFADIPFGISRIFESLMPQQIGANRHKNRSTQVKGNKGSIRITWKIVQWLNCYQSENTA